MLIRQHLNGCHFVPYLMKITGAKFEHHPSNILEYLGNGGKIFQDTKYHSSSFLKVYH